jgi:methyl-accepting chemotaxis protein
MKLSLRNRILITTLGLIFIVTLATSSIAYFLAKRGLETSVDDHMLSIVNSSLQHIETWIGGQRDAIVLLAQQRDTLAALTDSPDTAKVRPEVSSDLARMKSTCPFYEDVHLIDSTGMTRASSNPGSIDKLSVSDRQYFKDAMGGTTALSDVLASRTTGNPITVIATPVKQNDKVVGTLIGVVDLNWFSSRFITKIKVLETGYAFVYDRNGVFIAHPQTEKVLKTKLADFAWGNDILQKGTGHLDYTFEGIHKSATFTRSEALKWGVVATVPLKEANASATRLGMFSALFGAIALVAGAILVMLLSRSIAKPIKEVADSLAAGSDQTTAAANQVASSSQSLAEGASEQAASLEETSSSLEEMSSMTKRNADSTSKAGELARHARTSADTGVQDMQTMTAAMEEIKKSSDEVGKIIKTIDEIAFQTNILALNAAVEAARAGEAGLGFAVVAEEVRNLAQRSATAAKETANKIERAISKTAQGVQISSKVAVQLETIVQQVRQMDELMAEITAASKEQTHGIQQITTAVSQMDQVTQSNAASAEESASAAEELNAQAENLKEAVRGLLLLVEGSRQEKGASQPTSVPKVKEGKIKSQPAAGSPQRNGAASPAKKTHGTFHSEGARSASKSSKSLEASFFEDETTPHNR